jgi:hypothetical protein
LLILEAINGWNAFAGFIPAKQIGVIALCSCDPSDADMGSLGFVLLHLTGSENLVGKTESRIIPLRVRVKNTVHTKIFA